MFVLRYSLTLKSFEICLLEAFNSTYWWFLKEITSLSQMHAFSGTLIILRYVHKKSRSPDNPGHRILEFFNILVQANMPQVKQGLISNITNMLY